MPKKPMGRPKLDNPNVVTKCIRLNQKSIDDLIKIADKDGVTFSKIIRKAIDEYIKKRNDVVNNGFK